MHSGSSTTTHKDTHNHTHTHHSLMDFKHFLESIATCIPFTPCYNMVACCNPGWGHTLTCSLSPPILGREWCPWIFRKPRNGCKCSIEALPTVYCSFLHIGRFPVPVWCCNVAVFYLASPCRELVVRLEREAVLDLLDPLVLVVLTATLGPPVPL